MSWTFYCRRMSLKLREACSPLLTLSLSGEKPLHPQKMEGSGILGLHEGLWSYSFCLPVVLERNSAVLWCMSISQFQTSWLNPLTLCPWLLRAHSHENIFFLCSLDSLMATLVSSDLSPVTKLCHKFLFHALCIFFIRWEFAQQLPPQRDASDLQRTEMD